MHPNPENSTRLDLETVQPQLKLVQDVLAKTIVGQAEMIRLLSVALFSNGHVLIEGIPGVAKTLTAKLLAKLVDTSFSRIQFTPDLMPSDVLGTSIFNPKTTEFTYRKGPIFANMVLIDEINRAPAKTQAALFEVMEERQVTFDGETYYLGDLFMVIATQNPIEQEGTYRLPEAQLDRFMFKISVDFPNHDEELEILTQKLNNPLLTDISQIQPVINFETVLGVRSLVEKVYVDPQLLSYITKIVMATRNNPSIYLGASTRASIALLHAARVMAIFENRDFVTPDDIRALAIPVLAHRIQLTVEREIDQITTAHIIKEILSTVEVPR